MMKTRKGFCPPFIAIGLVVIFMLVTIATSFIPSADAATFGDGDDLPPPGGQWPPTTTTTTTTTGDSGGTVVTTPEHTDPPQDDANQGGTVVNPSEEPIESDPEGSPDVYVPVEETEPIIKEDPVGRYPSRLDTEGVKIVSPSLDELLAPGADLEALLYPSGLKLPTKYMDLLMCAPTNSSSNVVGETANFLKTIAPSATGTYTFAEYEAADVYLAICRCYMQDSGESMTGDALKNLDDNTTVNWMTNVTNATLSDSSRLVALISNYKSLLESYGKGDSIGSNKQYRDLVAEHKDVYYSLGDLTYYRALADGTAPNDQHLSVYTTNLYSTWSYLGVVQNITTNLLEYSKYYNEFALNGVNYNRGAPVSSFSPDDPNAQSKPQGGLSGPSSSGEGTEGGGTTQVTTPEHGGTGSGSDIVSGSTGQEWANPNQQGSGDLPVSSVGSSQGVDSSVLPSGRQSIQDIASKVALAFVVIGIAVVWGVHTHRKGSDPLSKWK